MPGSVATDGVYEVVVRGGAVELPVVDGGRELEGTFGKVVVNINDNVLSKKLFVSTLAVVGVTVRPRILVNRLVAVGLKVVLRFEVLRAEVGNIVGWNVV